MRLFPKILIIVCILLIPALAFAGDYLLVSFSLDPKDQIVEIQYIYQVARDKQDINIQKSGAYQVLLLDKSNNPISENYFNITEDAYMDVIGDSDHGDRYIKAEILNLDLKLPLASNINNGNETKLVFKYNQKEIFSKLLSEIPFQVLSSEAVRVNNLELLPERVVQPEEETSPISEGRKFGLIAIIGGIILLVALIVVGIFVRLRRKKLSASQFLSVNENMPIPPNGPVAKPVFPPPPAENAPALILPTEQSVPITSDISVTPPPPVSNENNNTENK